MANRDRFFVDRIDIQRSTTTRQSSGASTIDWAPVGSNVPCSIQPSTVQQQQLYGRQDLPLAHTIYMAPTQEVDERDRVVIGGLYFEVVAVDAPTTTYQWAKTVFVVRQKK
jgi:SPP1 family predicted phage head-tail adaptor